MRKIQLIALHFIFLLNTPLMATNDYQKMGENILSDLVAIQSTEDMGLATQASEYSENKLLEYGFSQSNLQVVGPGEDNKGLIAILRGESSISPTITMAHLDVVPSVENS